MKKMAREELNVLITCFIDKLKTITVVDIFEVYDNAYILIEHTSGKTLRETVLELGKTCLSESQTKKCIYSILKIVK